MTIYGVALLAFCYVTGQIFGEFLGKTLGVEANVGGVGFANTLGCWAWVQISSLARLALVLVPLALHVMKEAVR